MPLSQAFLQSAPLLKPKHRQTLRSKTPFPIRTSHQRLRPQRPTMMIQSPDSDGPPDLDSYFSASRRSTIPQGLPITLSTGRSTLSTNANSAAETVSTAVQTALSSLGSLPQLAHITVSPEIDVRAALSALRSFLPAEAAIFGRTVYKKEAQGTAEVLLLRTEDPAGICAASVRADGGDEQAVCDAAASAARSALAAAKGNCTFLLFTHSPGAKEASVRAALDKVKGGVVAYGGPAVGDDTSGWAVLDGAEGVVKEGDGSGVVCVAAVSGGLSFLLSAVVKTWAQPKYIEKLSFMTPSYVGDAKLDLLTAIRYDDWEKFMDCIEGQGVGIDVRWEEKQNQSPLLAACARLRTKMVKYLLQNGADANHRNNGGFTAAMYTRMLTEYDREVVEGQLKMLEEAGADIKLTAKDAESIKRATGGKIVE